MVMFVNKKTQKNSLYFCEKCDFNSNNKNDYSRHLLTAKHKLRISGNDSNIKAFCCENCDKEYRSAHGLWYHKKKCEKTHPYIFLENNKLDYKNMTEKQIISQILKLNVENKELKEIMIEQNSKVIEAVTTLQPNNTTINNNCTNKQFNLNLFLNDKCKNAMNMSDFLDTIQIEADDFENIGKLGYIQGISNIFIKGLKDLDEAVRPMHCNDLKRETIYIKDNNAWNKDDNKEKIINAIALIAHKNFKYIPIWQEANPSSYDVTTKKNDLYMKIANQVTTAITPDDEAGINKIIRNVASRVIIEK